jgi:hypothetical protein
MFFFIFALLDPVLSSVINGGTQFGNTRMYLSGNFNQINKDYEKFTLCFIICNDFDLIIRL